MFQRNPLFKMSKLAFLGLSIGIAGSSLLIEGISNREATAAPSFFEYRWDGSSKYKRLYYYQSSKEKRDRSTYYLVMKPRDRKTAILKLTIGLPEYFNANITPKKFSLCRISLGGMLTKTKCIEKIPAIFEVSQTKIEAFPTQPISTEGAYAVVMKIFNPDSAGMYQFNALAQAPGDVPMAGYLGSWNIDIE